MNTPGWLDILQGVGSIATPIVVAVLAFVLAGRRGQNEQLLAARMDAYRSLVPKLNTLMCYMTFIGPWASMSPKEVIAMKRHLDHEFYCAAPLFRETVLDAYDEYLGACFSTFNQWGEDARIRSGPFRRRAAWRSNEEWSSSWNDMFVKSDEDSISGDELKSIRGKYDALIAALVADLSLTKAKTQYTTDLVSLNAHAPAPRDIPGANDTGIVL